MVDKETTSLESDDGRCDFLPSNGSENHQSIREITVKIREKLVSRKLFVILFLIFFLVCVLHSRITIMSN